ncbi:hypothetical protein V9T40_003101 [Parthenolecanium corni]|uniref:Small ribosomal subunit protein uS10m n=1 Tax=Parthenolecanium corni TaxID=536013 RepID=A0AAN9TSI9_9HEMI
MNSALQNLFRYSRSSLRPTFAAPYSAVAHAVESEAAGEPDKLYQTISIEMRANEHSNMTSYSQFARMAAGHLGITIGRCYIAPTFYQRDKLCLLRSAFTNKNCRIQYEVRTYYRYMTFHNLTGSTADTFLEYIERNLPEGIALKITKVEVQKLPEELVQPRAEEESSDSTETSSESESEK